MTLGRERLGDLAFRVTAKCNMECPWCSLGDKLNSCEGENDDAYLQKAKDCLDRYDVEDISILGGEPTLKMDLVRDIVAYARSTGRHDGDISFMTNGLLLREGMIEWFVDNQIYLNVATTGRFTGVKNINTLLKLPDFYKVFTSVPKSRFTVVLEPDEDFADRVLTLVSAFDARVSLPFNVFRKDFSDANIERLEYNLAKCHDFLHKNGISTHKIHFPKFFAHHCPLDGRGLEPDLSMTSCRCSIPKELDDGRAGCLGKINSLGTSTYERIYSVLDKYEFIRAKTFPNLQGV